MANLKSIWNRTKGILGLPVREDYPNDEGNTYQPQRVSRTVNPGQTAQSAPRPEHRPEPAPASRSRFEDEYTEVRPRAASPAPAYREPPRPERRPMPMRRPGAGYPEPPRRGGQNGETLVASIATIPDTRKLINALVRGYTIVMTIDNDEQRTRERVLDTMCGAVFALGANIQRANGSSNTYVVAPKAAALRSYEDISERL